MLDVHLSRLNTASYIRCIEMSSWRLGIDVEDTGHYWANYSSAECHSCSAFEALSLPRHVVGQGPRLCLRPPTLRSPLGGRGGAWRASCQLRSQLVCELFLREPAGWRAFKGSFNCSWLLLGAGEVRLTQLCQQERVAFGLRSKTRSSAHAFKILWALQDRWRSGDL